MIADIKILDFISEFSSKIIDEFCGDSFNCVNEVLMCIDKNNNCSWRVQIEHDFECDEGMLTNIIENRLKTIMPEYNFTISDCE